MASDFKANVWLQNCASVTKFASRWQSKQRTDLSAAPPPLATLIVRGEDAENFLQGQLTQDVRRADHTPRLAGYCSAKGRLLAVLWLARTNGGFALTLHRSLLEAVHKRLRMYVLRSKVQIEAQDCAAEDDCTWRAAQIAAGVPVIFPQTQDLFVPQMVNLDRLGGISFDKGCYTGQEIVARLHYLGQLKRRMFRCTCPAAQPGDAVMAVGETQAVGNVVDAVQGQALVVLQLAHANAELRLENGAPLGPAQVLEAPA